MACYITQHFSDGIRVTVLNPENTSPCELANASSIICKFTSKIDLKIETAYVEVHERKKGVFKRMMSELEDWARKNNFKRIWGNVVRHPNGPDESTLKEIYKKAGFTIKTAVIEKIL